MNHCVLLLLLLPVAAAVLAAPDGKLVVVLLGPPGGGKGTQAEFITRKYGLPPVSTGELLRAEVKQATPLGQRIQGVMAKGELVSDDIVNALIEQRISQPDAARGFILDGYPRTVAQARFLDTLLPRKGFPKPSVIVLKVPAEEIVARLAGRGRADDKPEVVRERIAVYERQTAPLIEYYAGAGRHDIDGLGAPEEVFARIDRVLAPKAGR